MHRKDMPYEPTLRDRRWMWGHDAGSTNGLYGIPSGGSTMPGADSMGIPTVCMMRWRCMPEPPFDGHVKQVAATRRLAGSIIGDARQPYQEKKRMAVELADDLPNLVSVYLADFFSKSADDVLVNKEEAAADLTVESIRNLKAELDARERAWPAL